MASWGQKLSLILIWLAIWFNGNLLHHAFFGLCSLLSHNCLVWHFTESSSLMRGPIFRAYSKWVGNLRIRGLLLIHGWDHLEYVLTAVEILCQIEVRLPWRSLSLRVANRVLWPWRWRFVIRLFNRCRYASINRVVVTFIDCTSVRWLEGQPVWRSEATDYLKSGPVWRVDLILFHNTSFWENLLRFNFLRSLQSLTSIILIIIEHFLKIWSK